VKRIANTVMRNATNPMLITHMANQPIRLVSHLLGGAEAGFAAKIVPPRKAF